MSHSVSPRINIVQIKRFASFIKNAAPPPSLNFYSYKKCCVEEIVLEDMYPPIRAPGVIDFFFFAMAHNYGFWTDDGEKYTAPFVGTWRGKNEVNGSELLFNMLTAAWKKDAECFSPLRLQRISDAEFADIFSDDHGPIAFFNTDERRELTRTYARWFRVRRMAGQSPSDLVSFASEYADPAFALREILMHPENGVPLYREDPLGKKAELLLMALSNRPERFLWIMDSTRVYPLVDHHDMRVTLRMGHVVLPRAWVKQNQDRLITSRNHEDAIRKATFRADELTMRLSGCTRDEIDFFKWSARKYCTEIDAPNCSACGLQSVCAKHVTLFQPIYRTTYY